MTDDELQQLEALEAKATAGPWEYDTDDGEIDHVDGGAIGWIQDHGNVRTELKMGEPRRNADGHLVVALRNAAPALLQSAREANELRAQVRTLREAIRSRIPKGHNDTCQSGLTGDPCNCGHVAIVEILTSTAPVEPDDGKW